MPVPYDSKLHNCHLLAAQQDLYNKTIVTLNEKWFSIFCGGGGGGGEGGGGLQENGSLSDKITRLKEQKDQADKQENKIGKSNQMTALKFQTGGGGGGGGGDIRRLRPPLGGMRHSMHSLQTSYSCDVSQSHHKNHRSVSYACVTVTSQESVVCKQCVCHSHITRITGLYTIHVS